MLCYDSYPTVSSWVLLSFASTYLYEAGFSIFVNIKTKARLQSYSSSSRSPLVCIHQRIDYKISSLVFKSLLVKHSHTCLSPLPLIFLVGAGSDQQPDAPSLNICRTCDAARSIDPQIWNRLPLRLPTLIQPDFHSKSSSWEKATHYIKWFWSSVWALIELWIVIANEIGTSFSLGTDFGCDNIYKKF